MQYYSLSNPQLTASFKDAVIKGIAPDKGLYFPDHIAPLPLSFFPEIQGMDKVDIGVAAMQQFVGDDIPEANLRDILKEVLDFDFPVVPIEDKVATLELFHGPTMAFKDVGARFMARCLGYFSQGNNKEVTVLVATSGDTGGAVANAFLGVKGVKVVILYPSKKVSDIQERQLTTLGQNVTAMEVAGSFDDCQRMVKTAFLDTDITQKVQLTSANSINVARWLPQSLYFMFAYQQVAQAHSQLVFSVPSGNFGNICAGMVAQKLGMPVAHFVASTNVNDIVPQFMASGSYTPKPSQATISNAMDVGDPSNFVRIRQLYGNDFEELGSNLSSYSFTDDETREAMRQLYANGYTADPHGAVGYLGAKKYLKDHPGQYGIFLETAHPIKFLPVLDVAIRNSIAMPEQIKSVMDKEKVAIPIASYGELKAYLLD